MIYYLIFIFSGFVLGSILFSKLIPKLVEGKDICELGSDHNPGAANVFMKCGVKMGAVCLFFDMLKGFLPVFIASFVLDSKSLWFSLVILAPVLGHALGVFNKFHGGKCISTSFGVVLGMMPVTRIGFLLAIIYVAFCLIKIKPHTRLSIISFGLFAIGALIFMCIYKKYSIALGCVLFSLVAILKHTPIFAVKENTQISKEDECYEKV